jgi:hypothetical protein
MTVTETAPGTRAVVGVFNGFAEARWAVEELKRVGYHDEDIGVIGPDGRDAKEHHTGLPGDPTHTRWEEGAGIGAAAGATAGLGLGIAVTAGLIPPLGPVVAGGTLVALLASAGGGAAVGTFVGALCGLGIPEEEAHWYAKQLEEGKVVVTVQRADGRIDAAADVLRRAGAESRNGTEIGTYGTGILATPY